MSHDKILLRAVLNSLSEGVAIADPKGTLIAFNHAARRFFDPTLMQHGPDQWSTSFGLFLPDAKTPFPVDELPLVRAVRGLHTERMEMFVRNARVPAGAWLSLTGRPIRDISGRILGGVAVFHDITERKKAEQEIVEISGREQRRIGQDLHDGLCQVLLAAQFTTRVLQEKLAQNDVPPARDCAQEIRDQLNHALAQADVIARGLYPVELESRGLMAALIELARNSMRVYPVDIRLVTRKPVRIDDPVLATHLYRIAQEAVSNAIKGGKATRITIRLAPVAKRLVLSIMDNGIGIPKKLTRRGMGLTLMAYRAQLVSAQLVFRKRKGGGTEVLCRAPGASLNKKAH